ncbi:unnamed protein product [Polarella glacialis]|uniref:CBS domain-containing protein n=1 Tax=Polarella glacialis TaxID=89957 RepID=A0A813JQ95_POLGL|nr:unnamed protein product [Polarella glacialis]
MQKDVFGGLTVRDILPSEPLGCKLLLHYALGDAASALAGSGCTAAAVLDQDGQLVGLLTENDVMRAYFEGASPDHRLADWFVSGLARAPTHVLRQKLTVRPTDALVVVAEHMVTNALTGDCACHHVLVEGDDGKILAILSAFDMAQAICRSDRWDNPLLQGAQNKRAKGDGDEQPQTSKTLRTASTAVQDIMKPRESVFTCPPLSTMKDVLKVLLLTRQNSALVVDEEGIYGIVTPRDAVRAFADGVPGSMCIADWLRRLESGVTNRLIASTASIEEAAALMTARKLQHLVVVPPGGIQALGIVSALDLVVGSQSCKQVLCETPIWEGPTLGELLVQQPHLTAICSKTTTLGEAAQSLLTTGRTSAAVALSPFRLLTENDIMRAYADGWPRESSAEHWLLSQESPRAMLPQHLLVPPSVPLTEAASLMLGVAVSAWGDPCHHLVVKGVQGVAGGWQGVFSALDIARGLCTLGSELEVAKTGADLATVSMFMKPLWDVPTCRTTDSIQHALASLVNGRQNAVLVMDENGAYQGLITPRCALHAMAEAVPRDRSVAEHVARDWLRGSGGSGGEGFKREVFPESRLLDAASIMAARSLHHLVVVDRQESGTEPSQPVGVLSALDVARGVASMRCRCPFASLGWLWWCRGPSSCSLWSA